MTNPVKPPGGGPPKVPPVDEAKGPSKSTGAAGPEESFKAKLDQVAGASGAEGTEKASAAAPVGELEEIAAALRAGEIDGAAAIERLVARALQSPAGQALNEVGRAQLEAQIRRAIESDPSLQALVGELDAK